MHQTVYDFTNQGAPLRRVALMGGMNEQERCGTLSGSRIRHNAMCINAQRPAPARSMLHIEPSAEVYTISGNEA